MLPTKMMIFGNTTNTTCWFSFKQYNLFYTVQKHEICRFPKLKFPEKYMHDTLQWSSNVKGYTFMQSIERQQEKNSLKTWTTAQKFRNSFHEC